MAYDLVIKNGTIVDGSGRPRYRGDVAVAGGRITAIGRISERGKREIDADGYIVAPGFIECHSHLDAQVFWDPVGMSSACHGVTTTIMGNCGFTLAPCRKAEMDLCLRSLERAEDMSRDCLLAGLDWTWETFPEYFDAVDARSKAMNYAGYVGHSALRAYVMGERAFESPASDADLAAMQRHLEAGLRAGAVGFSTSRNAGHRTADDRPVASRLADWHEMHALVGVMGKLNTGLFEIAMHNPMDPAQRAAERANLAKASIDSGRPLTWILTQFAPRSDAWKETLAFAEDLTTKGGRLVIQAHPRQLQSMLSFRTQLPFDRLPEWSRLRARPLAEQRRMLQNPQLRATLVREAIAGPYSDNAVGGEARPPQWDEMFVFDSATGPHRRLSELSRAQGKPPAEVLLDMAVASDLEQMFAQPFANHDVAAALQILQSPHAVLGGSDSGAHVSQILDCSIPTFFLAHWVREAGAFTLEQAVKKMTFDIALNWGFAGRGLVSVGAAADLVVFDPQVVSPAMPSVADDLPAKALRLKQGSIGIRNTIVAGEVVMEGNEPTGATPGRLLRNPVWNAS